MKLITKYILSNFGGRVANKEEVERVCDKFGVNAGNTINYMINYGFFVRILRGLYYVKTIEEFKFKKALDAYRLISLGMEKLRVDWYFGLYTSLRLNGLTHEFFDTIFVLNDEIFRPKEIRVSGEKVKFIKLKSKLFGFGIFNKNGIKFSDPEKTLLDLIYVFKYRNVAEERIISTVEDYFKKLEKKKLREYLKFYPKSVLRVVENAKLI
jgi:predicted transcriptional regulator of viral defense system